jgi:hypothetical protein
MEEGIVAVTGHLSGEFRLWSLRYKKETLVMRGTVEGNPHSSPSTGLVSV